MAVSGIVSTPTPSVLVQQQQTPALPDSDGDSAAQEAAESPAMKQVEAKNGGSDSKLGRLVDKLV